MKWGSVWSSRPKECPLPFWDGHYIFESRHGLTPTIDNARHRADILTRYLPKRWGTSSIVCMPEVCGPVLSASKFSNCHRPTKYSDQMTTVARCQRWHRRVESHCAGHMSALRTCSTSFGHFLVSLLPTQRQVGLCWPIEYSVRWPYAASIVLRRWKHVGNPPHRCRDDRLLRAKPCGPHAGNHRYPNSKWTSCIGMWRRYLTAHPPLSCL